MALARVRFSDLGPDSPVDIPTQPYRLNRLDDLEVVRLSRQPEGRDLGFASRPFVLCGLPVRRPEPGTLVHERRNGKFVLQVTGHPEFGLPWGQDRLIPIFLATLAVRQQSPKITFQSAAEMLETFGMQPGGSQYRRLVVGFKRIFGATIFFGTDRERTAAVFHQSRFHFLRQAEIWYARKPEAGNPESRERPRNTVVLTDEFFQEIVDHPIPTDLRATRVLAGSPAALDLFAWLSYRCYVAKREEKIPLFGEFGLAHQLGSVEYARPRRFREGVLRWLEMIAAIWPVCPARISADGEALLLTKADAIRATKRPPGAARCERNPTRIPPDQATHGGPAASLAVEASKPASVPARPSGAPRCSPPAWPGPLSEPGPGSRDVAAGWR